MTLNVHICKNDKENLSAIFSTDGNPYWFNTLFEFAFREYGDDGPAWYFWLRGWKASHIFKGGIKDFPTEFFVSACRAAYFFHINGNGEIPDDINIASGGEFIGKE